MVPLKVTATPESLHLLAHQAQLQARMADDWWDNPLDTALAAVGSTRHPPAFRQQGEDALEGLRRWRAGGQVRRVSSDTAALALAARAAFDLARRDQELEAEAVRAVEDLTTRGGPAAPTLHLALCAWALDTPIPDRSQTPWPQIRAHFSGRSSSSSSIETPLASLASTLAAVDTADPSGLVRSLLQEIPVSPGVEDAAILLWIATVAVESSAAVMSQADTGLRALVDRRTDLGTRLAQEIDSDAFRRPEIEHFDPSLNDDLSPAIYISPTEALLLDLSLASSEPDEPWLRFEDGERLFGKRGARAERKLARRSAGFAAIAGLLAGALVALVLVDLSVALIVAIPAGLAVASVGLLTGTLLIHGNRPEHLTEAVGLFFAATLLAASFDTFNQALSSPLIPDIGGFVAGAVGATLIVVIFSAFSRRDR